MRILDKSNFQKIMDNKDDYVILDTETTGFSKEDRIVEIAIIDMEGNPLVISYVYTDVEISEGASKVNNITNDMLVGAPTMEELKEEITKAIKGKTVLIYNSDYDTRMLKQSGYDEEFNSECLMLMYGDYIGSQKWVGLTRAMGYENVRIIQDHSAYGDCICCLELIKAIVN